MGQTRFELHLASPFCTCSLRLLFVLSLSCFGLMCACGGICWCDSLRAMLVEQLTNVIVIILILASVASMSFGEYVEGKEKH